MYSNGREMNSPLYSPAFKHPSDEDFAKIKALISSDPYPNYYHHQHNHNHGQIQQHDGNCGQNESSLMRYRSAPSSYFADLLNDNGSDADDFLDPVDELEERFFIRHPQKQRKSETDSRDFSRYESSSTGMKLESIAAAIKKPDRPPPPRPAMYGDGSRRVHNFPSSNINGTSNNEIDRDNLENSSAFGVMNSTNSNLVRQSSSPAGFLSSVNAENGFAAIKNAGKAISSSSMNNHISFSSQPSSSPMFSPQNPINRKDMNDSTFTSLKRSRDGDLKMFSSSIAFDTQNGASGHYTPSLVHHMSLPKTSLEMAAAEKILRFDQETVPCKLRAKRGHATHPRSIAERVRRTRISERMKKLQKLFPNMDKQTNIADMLEMAVDYIKDLQKEVQNLNEARARCSCSRKQ